MGFALRARVSVLGLCALAVVLVACASGCPTPESPPSSRLEWAKRLQSRRELSIDASRPISVKRDVHVLRVHADADQVASAFHQVMRDPQRRSLHDECMTIACYSEAVSQVRARPVSRPDFPDVTSLQFEAV